MNTAPIIAAVNANSIPQFVFHFETLLGGELVFSKDKNGVLTVMDFIIAKCYNQCLYNRPGLQRIRNSVLDRLGVVIPVADDFGQNFGKDEPEPVLKTDAIFSAMIETAVKIHRGEHPMRWDKLALRRIAASAYNV